MELRRLNMDSSWHITIGQTAFLVDPWLVGSEIDGARWLNEQWHTTPPVPIAEIPPYDFILITQSYADHCHLQTLGKLDPGKPILATRKAWNRLGPAFPDRSVKQLPDTAWLRSQANGPLSLTVFRPNKWIDPVYYAVAVADEQGNGLFYAPHGFTLNQEQLDRLSAIRIKLLITTFTDFRLPGLMGGQVNPGEGGATRLCAQLRPERVINTHDEEKRMGGLVARMARVEYPDYERLEQASAFNFLRIPNYEPVRI